MADEVLILHESLSEGELKEPEPTPAPPVATPSFPQRRTKPRHRVRPYLPSHPMRSLQVFHHNHGMGVICIRGDSFCITNGSTSFVSEKDPRMLLVIQAKMYEMNVNLLYVTDNFTRIRWRDLTKNFKPNDPLFTLPVITLKRPVGKCPMCDKDCIRWRAVEGYESLTRVKVDPIPH